MSNKDKDRSSKESNNKELKKPKIAYKYDLLINEVRKVTPLNRALLARIAVKKYVDDHRNEDGVIDSGAVKQIIADVEASRGEKKQIEIGDVVGI